MTLKSTLQNPKKTKEIGQIKEKYLQDHRRLYIFMGLLIMITLVIMILTISIGSSGLSIKESGRAILSKFFPSVYPIQDPSAYGIVWELRLPRIIVAVLAGAGLALAGVVMQALTRNPLVSSFTVGISNAAAFGASISILIGARLVGSNQLSTMLGAFICAGFAAALVYGIAARRGMDPVTIVLTGTALTYMFAALTNTIQYITNDDKLAAVIHWTFGNFSGIGYSQILILLIIFIITLTLFLRYAWIMNALASGNDEIAQGLGINVFRIRILLGIASVVLAASIVSCCGVIGFVGIVSPHLARLLIGPDHKFLLPFSALIGALLVLFADIIGRMILAPIVIPVGIVVAYIGVPIFLQLIFSKKEVYFK